MLQRQLSHFNGRKLDHRQVLTSYIFYDCFSFSYTATMFILMIFYDFWLFPAPLCYTVIYIRNVESCVQIAEWCAPWKISNGAQDLVLYALQL
jgi:hypothetical protein